MGFFPNVLLDVSIEMFFHQGSRGSTCNDGGSNRSQDVGNPPTQDGQTRYP